MKPPAIRIRLGKGGKRVMEWLGVEEFDFDLDLREIRNLFKMPVTGRALLPERIRVVVVR